MKQYLTDPVQANKAGGEAGKAIKRQQATRREAEQLLEAESRDRAETGERAGAAERRAAALHGELEEARLLLTSAERGAGQVQAELAAARAATEEMAAVNSRAAAEKRALDGEARALEAELEAVNKQVQ